MEFLSTMEGFNMNEATHLVGALMAQVSLLPFSYFLHHFFFYLYLLFIWLLLAAGVIF